MPRPMHGGTLIYLVSLTVFFTVIFTLVGLLLAVESQVSTKGKKSILVNDDPKSSLSIHGTPSLLSALGKNGIFLPSACGGSGSCGMCKCVVKEGGGAVLPTEFAHLSRKEKLQNKRLSCQLKVKNDLKIEIPQSIFGITKIGAEVVSNNNAATYIKELILKPDTPFRFKAGAYIQIDVPEYEACFKDFSIDSKYVSEWKKYNLLELISSGKNPGFRAYSLANPPHETDILKMTVKIATPPPGALGIPPGFGSSYIFSLKPGQQVTISGPYGDFFVKESDREKCFIGGGAGIAPLRCHVLDQLEGAKTDKKISLWYGARCRKEMCYDDTFKRLETTCPNFSYHVSLSQPAPEENWTGAVGHIQETLARDYLMDHDDPTEIEYYLCGPPGMVDCIVKTLDDLGVDHDMIFYDKYEGPWER